MSMGADIQEACIELHTSDGLSKDRAAAFMQSIYGALEWDIGTTTIYDDNEERQLCKEILFGGKET